MTRRLEVVGVVGDTPDGRRKLGFVIIDTASLPFREDRVREKKAFLFPMSLGGGVKW